MDVHFKKPIAVIDLETTGLDIATAKIVSIGIVILDRDGSIKYRNELRVNPGMEIPEHAVGVHGITNEMAKDSPLFSAIAGEIAKLLEGYDLAGYNVEEYDLPILKREFADAGIFDFSKDAKVVDVKVIFNKKVRRNLSSAVRHYLNRPHENAHNALADAQATADVLLRQLAVHDLPSDADALQSYCHERDTDDWS